MLLPHGLQVLVVESQSSMRAQLRNMLASIGIDSPQFAVWASMAMYGKAPASASTTAN